MLQINCSKHGSQAFLTNCCFTRALLAAATPVASWLVFQIFLNGVALARVLETFSVFAHAHLTQISSAVDTRRKSNLFQDQCQCNMAFTRFHLRTSDVCLYSVRKFDLLAKNGILPQLGVLTLDIRHHFGTAR